MFDVDDRTLDWATSLDCVDRDRYCEVIARGVAYQDQLDALYESTEASWEAILWQP